MNIRSTEIFTEFLNIDSGYLDQKFSNAGPWEFPLVLDKKNKEYMASF